MITPGEAVFVDTGAWVALAETADALHDRARAQWRLLGHAGARLYTSVPVIIETFTFLDRHGPPGGATRWRRSLEVVDRFEILTCSKADLNDAWQYFDRKEFHRLSIVDATSFTLMRKHKIRVAFAFDAHFAIAGFHFVG